jgi:hypothetical protein
MSTRVVIALLLIGGLFGCGEKPQNFYQSDRRVQDQDQTAGYDGQRQRTMGQDESARIYGGMLR